MSVLKALAKRKHLLFALPALILVFGLTFTTYHVKGFSLVQHTAKAVSDVSFPHTTSVRPYDTWWCSTSTPWNCNNTDPNTSGGAYCATNSPSTIMSTWLGNKAGELDMRWSNGCSTNWARTIDYSAVSGSQMLAIIYYDQNNCGNQYPRTNSYPSTVVWSNQYYAPNAPVEVLGEVTNTWGNGQGDGTTLANPGWNAACANYI